MVILALLLSACTKATESVSTEPEVTVSSSAPADTSDTTAEKTNLEKSLEADEVVTILKAPDGQPLIFEGYEKEFGQRPDDPESLRKRILTTGTISECGMEYRKKQIFRVTG